MALEQAPPINLRLAVSRHLLHCPTGPVMICQPCALRAVHKMPPTSEKPCKYIHLAQVSMATGGGNGHNDGLARKLAGSYF
ncbi:hypothetical protein J8I26_04615 [Herbaspirillum sp. LeCh32-8]|nr:hypothetical protein [Herbaspirillum sp. LeCh32-8]